MNIYDIFVKSRDGKEVALKDYEGKVLLIVNTATGCGFTPQYTGLQKLYDTYKDKGFEILDFPCNQFANQAPGSDDDIHTFCTGRFGITFPQFAKIDVNGKTQPSPTAVRSSPAVSSATTSATRQAIPRCCRCTHWDITSSLQTSMLAVCATMVPA